MDHTGHMDHTAPTAQDTDLDRLELKFQKKVTSLEALKKAAYALIRDMSVQFLEKGDDYICHIEYSKRELPDSQHVEKIFRREVLDQELRREISEKTEPLRNLILANAFSRSGVIDPDNHE